ncbi:MAG: 3-deoxy-D-manno-octulosonic acid transferase, partial [Pseudomonadota bacterium]
MQRSGVRSSKISVSAELRVSPNPTPWPEEELNQTTATLGGRPVWLAAWVKQGELPSVLWAHKNALRLLHRLVLVLHIEEGGEQAVLLQQLRAMNLRVADWDAGDPIEDNTQVILSNTTEDLGLWYRMAPVSFLGGSLNPGSGGHDPLNAIALGSALLYGPNIGSHIETYARLAAAGAARCVRDSEALSENVVSLLSPDRAAEMALAGWRVVTESAFLTDQLIELIEDRLDGIESTDARP